MYELQPEKKPGTRVYINKDTGMETKTNLIYTDREGRKYWGFADLFQLPQIRAVMAKNITDLYNIGLTLKDIQAWCNEEKALLNSNDPEKYQKLYALILEKEKLATYTADPIKQRLALATVYILMDDERPDYFDQSLGDDKLQLWKGDHTAVAFFLTWLENHMKLYMKRLNKFSQTVSSLQKLKEDQDQQLKSSTELVEQIVNNNSFSGQ